MMARPVACAERRATPSARALPRAVAGANARTQALVRDVMAVQASRLGERLWEPLTAAWT